MHKNKSSGAISPEEVYLDHLEQHRGIGRSVPALVHVENEPPASAVEKQQVLESLADSRKYIDNPPPIIFRHSSAERIITDDQRPSAKRLAYRGEGLAVPTFDAESPRPVSARSTYSTADDDPMLKSITLTWSDITVRAGEPSKFAKFKRSVARRFNRKRGESYDELESRRTRILKNVNGVATHGRLLAIMGASGSGKTTLLNVLTYRNIGHLSISGRVRANGDEVGSMMRTLAAYVQQDDLFIPTLKVREHLTFQARLRLGKNLSNEQRTKRVDDVIADLGLGKCQNTIIGGSRSHKKGISGGERKRLAFASEVLTNPSVLFCDEPTSGLDSFMAIQTIEVLKKLARRGKTLVCTIHQPSSQVFELFDDLCLLADGRVAYLGPAKQAKTFFDSLGFSCPPNFNPADHYIRVLAVTPGNERECKRRIKKICRAYDQSETNRNVRKALSDDESHQGSRGNQRGSVKEAVKRAPKYKSTWCQQFNALLWRSWLGNIREPMLIPVRFMQTILISVLLGLVYYDTKLEGNTGIQNVTGLLFMFITNMTFQYCFAVVNVFCEELPIFLREHFSSVYRVDTYYLSKIICELPQYIIFPFLFTVILYFMTGLEPNAGVFFVLSAINILSANVAVSVGYAISCVFENVNIALSVAPAIIIPSMLFGGYYINLDTVPAYFYWLQYVSYFKYSFEAEAINQLAHVENIPGCGSNGTCPSTGLGVLENLSISPDSFALDIIILAVMLVVIRAIGFLALLIRTYTRKD